MGIFAEIDDSENIIKTGEQQIMPRNTVSDMDKLERTGAAWLQHARDAKFYGLLHQEYDVRIERSRDVRRRLEEARRLVAALENERNDVDRENLELEVNIAKAIGGSPDHGEDSTLYEATGRKRKSERKRPGKRVAKTDGGK